MKTIRHAYNLLMRWLRGLLFTGILLGALLSWPQQPQPVGTLQISTDKVPKASLWNHYSFELQGGGGSPPYQWRVAGNSLPHGIQLQENGILTGEVDQLTQTDFTVTVMDHLEKQQSKTFTFATEVPLAADWSREAQVNGQRIDGSIKVSNTTGRDFDTTFVVLAVNEVGRATAIGYQHFSLKQNTKDLEIPFGDTLPYGNYAVHVDIVGEEPQSNMIFRARRVRERLAITTGP